MALRCFVLPGLPYQLDQLATENDNQSKLSAFFTPEKGGVSEIANVLVDSQLIFENDNQSPSNVDSSLPEGSASLEQRDKCSVELDDLPQGNINNVMPEEPACSVENSYGEKGAELNDPSPSDGKNSDFKHKSSTFQDSASVSCNSNSLDNHNSSNPSSSRVSLPPNRGHSTLADPNFVENYFKVRTSKLLVIFSLICLLFGSITTEDPSAQTF